MGMTPRRRATLQKIVGRILGTLGFPFVLLVFLPLHLWFLIGSRLRRVPGTAVPRYYWHDFLGRNRHLIRGRAAELGGGGDTCRAYGGQALTQVDCIDLVAGPGVTIQADLCRAWNIPADRFDALVVPFTFHILRDDRAAFVHSLRMLKPGGALLCCFPSISGYAPDGSGIGWYVRRWYTPSGVRDLLEDAGLHQDDYEIVTYGSLASHTAYVYGLVAEAVPGFWLRRSDPRRPVLVCLRARKPSGWVPPAAIGAAPPPSP